MACGAALLAPRDYTARLVWALDHPDGDTAIQAANVLGQRGEMLAIEPLGRTSQRVDDPYRAAAAVRALRAFPNDPVATTYRDAARSHPSVIVRRAAREESALRRDRPEDTHAGADLAHEPHESQARPGR
jgi:hypothetical protein